jgi:hypothetical protein
MCISVQMFLTYWVARHLKSHNGIEERILIWRPIGQYILSRNYGRIKHRTENSGYKYTRKPEVTGEAGKEPLGNHIWWECRPVRLVRLPPAAIRNVYIVANVREEQEPVVIYKESILWYGYEFSKI